MAFQSLLTNTCFYWKHICVRNFLGKAQKGLKRLAQIGGELRRTNLLAGISGPVNALNCRISLMRLCYRIVTTNSKTFRTTHEAKKCSSTLLKRILPPPARGLCYAFSTTMALRTRARVLLDAANKSESVMSGEGGLRGFIQRVQERLSTGKLLRPDVEDDVLRMPVSESNYRFPSPG